MPTDPQTLLSAGRCAACISSASAVEVMELSLTTQILQHMAGTPVTDPQGLYNLSKCYVCMGVSDFQAMKLALLAQISQAKNASNPVDAQTLMTQGKCFPCHSTANTGQIMELALLAQIANS